MLCARLLAVLTGTRWFALRPLADYPLIGVTMMRKNVEAVTRDWRRRLGLTTGTVPAVSVVNGSTGRQVSTVDRSDLDPTRTARGTRRFGRRWTSRPLTCQHVSLIANVQTCCYTIFGYSVIIAGINVIM